MIERTQAEFAYKELTRRMLILEIPPNERLKEEDWAKKLCVSRSAIRETLTRLQGEGLVEPGARGGFFMREMTDKNVYEIRELREILETSAFSLACDRASSEILEKMNETRCDFASLFEKGYLTGACEADVRFHYLLVTAAGNERLSQMYQRSHIPLFHMKIVGRSRFFKEDFSVLDNEHGMIVEALRNNEKKKGIDILKNHFRHCVRNAEPSGIVHLEKSAA